MDKRAAHIVLVTHGERLHYLEQTIPALLRTEYPHTITVIANEPGDAETEYLLTCQGLAEVTFNFVNVGFAKAANQGWQRRPADTEYVVTTADDLLPLNPDWLGLLVEMVERCHKIGIAGHSVEPTIWPTHICGGVQFQKQPSNLGGVTLIPKRTELLCGRYNEELPVYGEEDALYGWKVRQAGLICAYWHGDHTRRFRHLGATDSAQYSQWKNDQRYQWAIPARDALIKEYEAGRPLNS